MPGEKRYGTLDGIRAISCMGIVAMHLFGNAQYDVHGFLFEDFVPSLTNLVFLFMTISGFGMCCGYYDRLIKRQPDIVDFYKRRYKKILPFFALLCLVDFIISPSKDALFEVFANLTLCFGLIPNADITVVGVGWFLGVVFAFYLLFPFFCYLLADKRRAWLSFAASILMNYVCANYFNAGRNAIAYSFVYFMVGGMVFLYKDVIKENKLTRAVLLIVMLGLIMAYYSVAYKTLIMILFNMIVLVYAVVASDNNILNVWPLKMLGGISFEVYLCHMMIYRVVEKVHLLRMFSNEYVNYLFVYIAVLGGAISFAIFGKWLINKMFICIEKRRII